MGRKKEEEEGERNNIEKRAANGIYRKRKEKKKKKQKRKSTPGIKISRQDFPDRSGRWRAERKRNFQDNKLYFVSGP